MQGEIWKDIPGYEGKYQASTLGRIKSLLRGTRILRLFDKGNGYLKVSLGYANQYLVHRLIARTFLSNTAKRPDVNHINSNRSDNRVANLEWITRKGNQRHAATLGNLPRGDAHHMSKLTSAQVKGIRRLCERGIHMTTLGKIYGVSPTTIAKIRDRKGYKHVV